MKLSSDGDPTGKAILDILRDMVKELKNGSYDFFKPHRDSIGGFAKIRDDPVPAMLTLITVIRTVKREDIQTLTEISQVLKTAEGRYNWNTRSVAVVIWKLSENEIVPILFGTSNEDCAFFFKRIWDKMPISKAIIDLIVESKTKKSSLEDFNWDMHPCQKAGGGLKDVEDLCIEGIPKQVVEALREFGTGHTRSGIIDLFRSFIKSQQNPAKRSKREYPDVGELERVFKFYAENHLKIFSLSDVAICEPLSAYNEATVNVLCDIAMRLPDRAILALIRLLELLHELMKLHSNLLTSFIPKKLRETFGFEKVIFPRLLVQDSDPIIAILLSGLSDISAFKSMVRIRDGQKRPKVAQPTSPVKEKQKSRINWRFWSRR